MGSIKEAGRPAHTVVTGTFAQISASRCDMEIVSRFVDTAVEILEAAENVARTGEAPSPLTFLIGVEGGIRIVADSDWPLESLQREHGARMAYRLSPEGGRITVDGREGSRTCHLEADPPARAARLLLNSAPSWNSFAQSQIA